VTLANTNIFVNPFTTFSEIVNFVGFCDFCDSKLKGFPIWKKNIVKIK